MSVSKGDFAATDIEPSSLRKEKSKINRIIVKYVSILQWLPSYTQLDAISDVVAGITLGLTMIPQSIAYAALAGLTAQYGLYSCFVGGFVYMIFGTIKEVSIGPSSLMALLSLEYTRNLPVDFIILLCFLTGCMELLMGLLNLGFVVDFISIPVTSGFTSGTAVIIIVSQLQGLLGLRFKARNVIENLFKLFENAGNIRIPDLSLGVCSICFLLLFRKLKDIDCSLLKKDGQSNVPGNAVFKKVLWFLSICRNALIILITSIMAYHYDMAGCCPFILSGKVKSGLPTISFPPFSSQVGNHTYTFLDMCSHYRAGIFVLPLVSILANVAIAKAFATGSSVNATQEMLTLGLCNILGSFVSSMPTSGAFTRSAVSSASGIKTPMAGLYTGTIALLALSFLTPYFYYIPRATLAAVLISAVVFMIDWRIIKILWKGCKRDAITAIVTFLFCIACGVEVGLFLGAIFNLIFFLRPSARPQIEVHQCKTPLGQKYVMLKPDTGLCYPAIDFFCAKVTESIQSNNEKDVPLIINCERLINIDYTAIKGIEKLSKETNRERSKLWFLYVKPEIVERIKMLTNINHFKFIENEDEIPSALYSELLHNGTDGDTTTKLLKGVLETDMVAHSMNGKNACTRGSEKIVIEPEERAEEVALISSSCLQTK